jgi:hypothetical protein
VSIHVLPNKPGHFRVDVTRGEEATHHDVFVPERLMDKLDLPRLEPFELVEETFRFLLEREPATSIMREFSLDVVSRYFPEYEDEIRQRLM